MTLYNPLGQGLPRKKNALGEVSLNEALGQGLPRKKNALGEVSLNEAILFYEF